MLGRSRLRNSCSWVLLLLVLALVSALGSAGRVAANALSITAPDTAGDVGRYTSLVLDGNGYPVVSYLDVTNGHLKILHCNDPNCAGGDESITTPDTRGYVGLWTSLVLDAAGNPVVSYSEYGDGTNQVRLLHCDDPNCTGNDESISVIDANGGQDTSLALDAAGDPVIAYAGYSTSGTKVTVVHCNDPNCSSGNQSVTKPDPVANNVFGVSLVLDASGYPVVTSLNYPLDLRVMHCNDANCAGGAESITSPYPIAVSYEPTRTSLRLSPSGYPVITYAFQYGGAAHDLLIVRCDDPNCSGQDESVEVFAVLAKKGGDDSNSLVLDSSGEPVVSYYVAPSTAGAPAHLAVRHAPNNATFVDSAGTVGQYSSLALDSLGNPVVSYYDYTNGDLKILHCADPNCSSSTTATPTPTSAPAVGGVSFDADGSRSSADWPPILVGVTAALAATATAYLAVRRLLR